MSSFVAALQFLTFCPWPARTKRCGTELGAGASFFPVIGLGLGAILSCVDGMLQRSTGALDAVLLVALLTLLTRGFHLDGLADTFDGLGAGGDRERVLAVMDDSRTGAFGVTAIVLMTFCKVQAIESLVDDRWRALLCAPMLSRWAMVLLAYRSIPATVGLGSLFIGSMGTWQFLFATASAALFAAALLQMLGVVMMLSVGFFTLLWRRYLHWRLGGVTGDTFGALGEMAEGSVLVALALVTR